MISVDNSDKIFAKSTTLDNGYRRTDVYYGGPTLAYFSGHNGSGELSDNTMMFLSLRVHPDLRERKIATRLVSAFAYVAVAKGLSSIVGTIESQHSLRIINKLFDEPTITFTDVDPVDVNMVTLPMTMSQAIQSLERAEQFENDPENRQIGFAVEVDISEANLSQFEKPIEINSPSNL